MEITCEKAGDVLIARVSGELDLATARTFRARLDAELDRLSCRDLVLDFAGVTFVDSSGIGAILGRCRAVRERGGRLTLCRLTPHVQRLLDLSGVLKIVGTYRGVEEAVAAVGRKEVAAGGDRG